MKVMGSKEMARASLHSWERSFRAFPAMQAGGPFLHSISLHWSLCRLPNTGRLHCVSLDRAYAACQSHPMRTPPSLTHHQQSMRHYMR
jgi:hypothetical protein